MRWSRSSRASSWVPEDYLPKPFDLVLLHARLGACLDKNRVRDAVTNLVDTVALGDHEFKGLTRPVSLYDVTGRH